MKRYWIEVARKASEVQRRPQKDLSHRSCRERGSKMDRALQSGAATEAIDGVLPLLSEDEAYRLQKLPNHVELTSPKTASFFFF